MTLRTALRNLLKSPRLSLAAIACISLGAAATSAIATIVAATLLVGIAMAASILSSHRRNDTDGGFSFYVVAHAFKRAKTQG